MSVDPPTAQSDSTDALIERCLRGDQAAWESVVRQHWRRVFNIAYTFVGRHDLAEDLAQDVFLRIFRALGSFDRRANFQTWLISVSRNRCIDHYRSVRRERDAIDRDVDADTLAPVSSDASPYVRVERLDRRELLRQALARLPAALRTPVVLRDLQDLSYQEIAGKLSLAEGTVKSRINRGRAELARQVNRLRARQAAPRDDATPARPGRRNRRALS